VKTLEPFDIMLANVSIHDRETRSVGGSGTDVDAGVCQHDPLDERVEMYLAAGPLAGREVEYEIVSLIRKISDGVDKMGKAVARCNIVAARMIGRFELAAAEHHAWKVEHAR